MIGNVVCEKMLGKLHHVAEAAVEQWDNFCTYMFT